MCGAGGGLEAGIGLGGGLGAGISLRTGIGHCSGGLASCSRRKSINSAFLNIE